MQDSAYFLHLASALIYIDEVSKTKDDKPKLHVFEKK